MKADKKEQATNTDAAAGEKKESQMKTTGSSSS